MSDSVDQILRHFHSLPHNQQQEVLRQLRKKFPIHPFEQEFGITAEMVLGSLSRASELTRRMIRGVFAEAAFEVEVVKQLDGWEDVIPLGGLAYDFMLKDHIGSVRVQVKLQRSVKGRPMLGSDAPRKLGFGPDVYVIETQKTRTGQRAGSKTRPYRFREFDILAAAMWPSTGRWDRFRYTVADWLIPNPKDTSEILVLQPISPTPNDEWTDDFLTAVEWFRREESRRISCT